MIPELFPKPSKLLINPRAVGGAYPIEKDAGELVNLPEFSAKDPWEELVVVTPKQVVIGSSGKDKVPVGFQKWVFNVSIPFSDKWPDSLNTEDTGEIPFALIQKRDTLIAYVFIGKMIGISVEFGVGDCWRGQMVMYAQRVRRLMDRAV